MQSDFQQTLLEYMSDVAGRCMLANLSDEGIDGVARCMTQIDPYNNCGHLQAALRLVGGSGSTREILAHQLWCNVRDAQWCTGALKRQSLQDAVDIEGAKWFQETIGYPTVILAPMMLGTVDAVYCAQTALQRLAPHRPCLFYGEEMETLFLRLPELRQAFAAPGRRLLHQILDTLGQNGMFMTYPDFVYQGHRALDVEMFGVPRGLSSSFASICTRPGTQILPALQTRSGDRISIRFFEPFTLDSSAVTAEEKCLQQRVCAQLLTSVLEGLIYQAPSQWLLLGTLTSESPQMAMPDNMTTANIHSS